MRSIKNLLLLVLVLLAIGLSTLAWKQYQEIAVLRAAALGNGERADWQKRVWAAQKRAQNLENQLAAARPGGSAAGATAPSARGQPPGAAGNMMAGFASLMNRPEAVRLMAMREKAMLNARYGALFKKLALSPEKLAQFQSLLADRQSIPMDVMTAAIQQGIDPMQNPQEFRQLVQNAQADIEEKIKAALDPASYAQYQNYIQTEPQRMVVNQLQQSLSYTDTPLTTAQADQLIQILTDTSTVNGGGGAPGTGGAAVTYVNRTGSGNSMVVAVITPPPDGGGGFGGSLVTDETVTRAQSVLSTAQIQALREIQQQQQAAAQLRQQMMQNPGPDGAPPPLPIAAPPPPPDG
jgi:hypothetical protein